MRMSVLDSGMAEMVRNGAVAVVEVVMEECAPVLYLPSFGLSIRLSDCGTGKSTQIRNGIHELCQVSARLSVSPDPKFWATDWLKRSAEEG